MAMVRKQLYIAREQKQKLRRLAEDWGCTEAQVFRVALDRLADAEATIDGRLTDAGLLRPPPPGDDVPTGEAVEALEREYDTWANAEAVPLGLSRAVLEGRR